MKLPVLLAEYYAQFEHEITARLAEFEAPKTEEDIFYEFCYCICTPQSKALHAMAVVETLRQRSFYTQPFNPESVLCDRRHYIRFHRTKAGRLLHLRGYFPHILDMLRSETDPQRLRAWLAATVSGFGYKEASHVLRNLGYSELAIIDRHILRNLVRFGVVDDPTPPQTPAQYEAIERAFRKFATHCGLPLQALDLLLWAIETGVVLK